MTPRFSLDEWKNFLERMGCENLDTLKDEGKEEELRSWASFRGQTLSRSGEKKKIHYLFYKADPNR